MGRLLRPLPSPSPPSREVEGRALAGRPAGKDVYSCGGDTTRFLLVVLMDAEASCEAGVGQAVHCTPLPVVRMSRAVSVREKRDREQGVCRVLVLQGVCK